MTCRRMVYTSAFFRHLIKLWETYIRDDIESYRRICIPSSNDYMFNIYFAQTVTFAQIRFNEDVPEIKLKMCDRETNSS